MRSMHNRFRVSAVLVRRRLGRQSVAIVISQSRTRSGTEIVYECATESHKAYTALLCVPLLVILAGSDYARSYRLHLRSHQPWQPQFHYLPAQRSTFLV